MASNKISAGTPSKLTCKTDRSKAKKIQSALYQIADAASVVTDMQEFYAALHRSGASAHDLVGTLESELRQYIGGANQFDHITLLAVKRLEKQ